MAEQKISWDEYAEDVLRTLADGLNDGEALAMGALGLCGETAEVANEIDELGDVTSQGFVVKVTRHAGATADLIKKLIFHNKPNIREKIVNELGDVFWYLVILMDRLGISFEEVASVNIAKRRKRYPDGFSTERANNRED